MSLSNATDVAMTTIMENTSTKPLETADLAPAPLPTSTLPTDEHELKEFKKRFGADKTPEEHRAEYLAAHAGEPRPPFAGDPIRYAPVSPPPKKRMVCFCGASCIVM